MDVEYQAGTAGLRYAADKGLAVVIMEGLRGGILTGQVPPQVQEIWDAGTRRQGAAGTRGRGEGHGVPASPPLRVVPRTPADWALQWLWNRSEVSVVLSGIA
jgi:uncharacterized protein